MREVDDVEVGKEGGTVEELNLGGWCVGGDGKKGDLEAVVNDESFG